MQGHAYSTCAVMGSSGSLLQQTLGAEIDSHALVLRFNIGPTKGWEQYVGGKTNLRLTGTASWGYHEKSSEVVLVHTTSPDVLEVCISPALKAGVVLAHPSEIFNGPCCAGLGVEFATAPAMDGLGPQPRL